MLTKAPVKVKAVVVGATRSHCHGLTARCKTRASKRLRCHNVTSLSFLTWHRSRVGKYQYLRNLCCFCHKRAGWLPGANIGPILLLVLSDCTVLMYQRTIKAPATVSRSIWNFFQWSHSSVRVLQSKPLLSLNYFHWKKKISNKTRLLSIPLLS